ncbi:nitroreductase A, partial [Vibrio vulnificus]
LSKVEQYDQTMLDYYGKRSSNQKQASWSEQVTGKLAGESRPHILPYLHSKGLATK